MSHGELTSYRVRTGCVPYCSLVRVCVGRKENRFTSLDFFKFKMKKKNRKSNKNYGVQSTIALNFLSAAAAHFTRAASSVALQPNNAVWLLKYLNHEMYIFRIWDLYAN